MMSSCSIFRDENRLQSVVVISSNLSIEPENLNLGEISKFLGKLSQKKHVYVYSASWGLPVYPLCF